MNKIDFEEFPPQDSLKKAKAARREIILSVAARFSGTMF